MARTIGKKNIDAIKHLVRDKIEYGVRPDLIEMQISSEISPLYDTWEGAEAEIRRVIFDEISRIQYARNPRLTMAELESELRQFTGTEHWYSGKPLFPNSTYTDGIKYLADKAGAYWLIDLIFSYQHSWVKKIPFQLWTINVKKSGGRGIVEMRADADTPVLIRQVVGYTDFPVGDLKLYYIDNILLLPSEY